MAFSFKILSFLIKSQREEFLTLIHPDGTMPRIQGIFIQYLFGQMFVIQLQAVACGMGGVGNGDAAAGQQVGRMGHGCFGVKEHPFAGHIQ